MDTQKVAKELIKIAREIAASRSLLDEFINVRDVAKLEDKMDEQAYNLALKVYDELKKRFEIDSGEAEALRRLRQSIDRNMSEDMNRNNIFKAAHALGIKLPSMSF